VTPAPPPEGFAALPGRAVRGTYYRALLAAFAVEPLSLEGSLRHGGRYNPSGAFGALYCGERPAVCAAEIRKRAAGQRMAPYRLARIRVALHRVLDLTDPATLAALSLRADDLLRDEWQPTQRLAAQARAAGFEGLLAPSAAGPRRILVIFPDRLDPGSRIWTVGPPRRFPVASEP
jgi:RES domain-containing protein